MDFISTKFLDNLSFQLESILWQNIAWFWDFWVCFFHFSRSSLVFAFQGSVWWTKQSWKTSFWRTGPIWRLHSTFLFRTEMVPYLIFALGIHPSALSLSLGEWSRKSYPQGQDSPILSISMLVRQHTHTLPSSFVFKLHLT